MPGPWPWPVTNQNPALPTKEAIAGMQREAGSAVLDAIDNLNRAIRAARVLGVKVSVATAKSNGLLVSRPVSATVVLPQPTARLVYALED